MIPSVVRHADRCCRLPNESRRARDAFAGRDHTDATVQRVRLNAALKEAIRYFEDVRRELLGRGIVVSAAEAGLDLIEILAAGGYSDRVIALERDLVEVFSDAGMERNLRMALAYLAEQVKLVSNDAEILQTPIVHVRAFLRRLGDEPAAVFRQP